MANRLEWTWHGKGWTNACWTVLIDRNIVKRIYNDSPYDSGNTFELYDDNL